MRAAGFLLFLCVSAGLHLLAALNLPEGALGGGPGADDSEPDGQSEREAERRRAGDGEDQRQGQHASDGQRELSAHRLDAVELGAHVTQRAVLPEEVREQ